MKKNQSIISLFFSKIKALFVLSLVFVVGVGQAQNQYDVLNLDKLPELGASAHRLLSRSDEIKLGKAFLRSLQDRVAFIQDPLVQDYIQNLGHKLIAHTEVDPEVHPHFNFFIVNDSIINAFAGPDGHIGVHSGLVLMTQSEHELASVIAHEIAHVTQQHIARLFEKANSMTLPNIAAMVASIALATQDAQAGAAALTATMAANAHMTVSEIRKNEKEADRVGIKILANAGFDPYSMPRFFERMYKEVSRFENKELRSILSTHPVSENRLTDSLNRAEQFGRIKTTNSIEYELMLARLRVFTETDNHATESYFQQMVHTDKGNKKIAGQYGLAIWYLKNTQFDKAEALVKEIQQQSKTIFAVDLLEAEIKLAQNDIAASLKILVPLQQDYPSNKAVALQYMKALLFAEYYGKAKHFLLNYIRHYDAADPMLYFYLAETQSRLGDTVSAYQAKAEQFYLMGEYEQAMNHLKYALKEKDAVGQVIQTIKARIDQIQHEQDSEQS